MREACQHTKEQKEIGEKHMTDVAHGYNWRTDVAHGDSWRTYVAHGEQWEDRCGTSRHTEDIFGVLFGNNRGQMWTM